jgi:hypothetical protein
MKVKPTQEEVTMLLLTLALTTGTADAAETVTPHYPESLLVEPAPVWHRRLLRSIHPLLDYFDRVRWQNSGPLRPAVVNQHIFQSTDTQQVPGDRAGGLSP